MFSMNAKIRKPATTRSRARGKSSRRERPSRFFPIDAAWKAGIRERLTSMGLSQAELARRIGASPAAIVLLLKEQTIQSRLVPAVHEALHLDPPNTIATATAA